MTIGELQHDKYIDTYRDHAPSAYWLQHVGDHTCVFYCWLTFELGHMATLIIQEACIYTQFYI